MLIAMELTRGKRAFRVFISHSWDQRELYHKLVELLHRPSNFRFIDRSVPKERILPGTTEQIWDQIKMQICASDVLLAINTKKASSSRWMKREFIAADHFGMKIISVSPHGKSEFAPSRLVESFAEDRQVAWNADSIAYAVRTEYQRRRNAEVRAIKDLGRRFPNLV
jgi:hypothetical protein